ERTAHHYIPIVYAMTITTCPDPRQIATYLAGVHPTWFFAVPRVWEKLKAGLEAYVKSDPQKAPLLAAATERVERIQTHEAAGELPPGAEELFLGLRRMVGLDEAILVNVGAAPTPREVLVFWHAIGVPLAEIWGMSETCGAGASNPGE